MQQVYEPSVKLSLLTYTFVWCHLPLLKDVIIKDLRNSLLFVLRGHCYEHLFVITFPSFLFMRTLSKDFCVALKQRITFEIFLSPPFLYWHFEFCNWLYFFYVFATGKLEIILWPITGKELKFYSIHFKKLFIMETINIFKHKQK